ncbi:MAG: hypothetical protein WC683_01655 [bacterium]
MGSMREILEQVEVEVLMAEADEPCKAKYIDSETGRFKGEKGERFQSCVEFMRCKGGVDDPEALCAKIARAKGAAPGATQEEMDEALGRGCPPGMKMVFGKCVKASVVGHFERGQKNTLLKVNKAREKKRKAEKKTVAQRPGAAAPSAPARAPMGVRFEDILRELDGVDEAVSAGVVGRMAEAMLGAPKLEVLLTRTFDDEGQAQMFAGMIQGPLEALVAKALAAAGATVSAGVLSKGARELKGAARS